MAKVIAPNKEYNGISASVAFVNGEGWCEDKRLLDWFRTHGYTAEDEAKEAKAKTPVKKGK